MRVVGGGGCISLLNRGFVEMWHIPDDVLASGDDERALACALEKLCDPDAFIAKVRDLYAHPEIESFDTLAFKDGRAVERSSKPQRVDGVVVGRVWSFPDVTGHKRLEENLAHQTVPHRAERMIALHQRPFNTAGREVFIGPSTGTAPGGPDVDAGQLPRNADIAMYPAKRRGFFL